MANYLWWVILTWLLYWQIGARSYNRRSLHHIGDHPNPYQQAISIIGKTLAAFDDDNLIPCFGFGDGWYLFFSLQSSWSIKNVGVNHSELAASTHEQDVFSFYPDEKFCNGFEDVLSRYQEIVPHLRLAGLFLSIVSFLYLKDLSLWYGIWSRNSPGSVIGPTSFAPIIEMAMTIVEQSGGQYHVLLIIADGQVGLNV